MGTVLAYSLYSGIFLLAAYLLYKLVMAGEKQMSLNRAGLLGIYALSLAAWPLSLVRWHRAPVDPSAFDIDLGAFGVTGAAETSAPVWPLVAVGVYTAGLAVALLWTVVVVLRLVRIVRLGRHIDCGAYTLVLLGQGKVAPFSWGRYVVMGEADYEAAGALIAAHELAHIRCRHCLDLLLAQAVCVLMWYNPAAWLMREELKSVHEYQADAAVLDSGVDARNYQMLLIKKAVGTRFQSLANSLNHSKLKKRITMMYKEKNSGLRRMRGLVLALAPVVALAVVNIPAVASVMDGMRAASLDAHAQEPAPAELVAHKVSENSSDSKVSEDKTTDDYTAKGTLPTYPGGEGEMMRYLASNVHYPEAAQKAGTEGTVALQFTVNTDGSLSDFEVLKSVSPELDDEALRVARSMPAWTPGLSEDGRPVSCTYALPIKFKLAPSTKGNNVAVAGSYKKSGNEGLMVIGFSDDKTGKRNEVRLSNDGPKPVVYVDGVVYSYDELSKLDSNKIESVSVFKNEPDYPDGRIVVVLKK